MEMEVRKRLGLPHRQGIEIKAKKMLVQFDMLEISFRSAGKCCFFVLPNATDRVVPAEKWVEYNDSIVAVSVKSVQAEVLVECTP
jgi:hypothetical protein